MLIARHNAPTSKPRRQTISTATRLGSREQQNRPATKRPHVFASPIPPLTDPTVREDDALLKFFGF
ncbi:MAG: hypothetical protein IPK83_05930 [Planctomycetes bacterium]|nr:hypothetical protein [Planctomycetota bacterium]